MKKTQEILNIANRMKELYVTYRQVWIEQKADGTYHTERKYKLHDDRLTDHLLQAKTVGLTVDKVTKFITFDIDYGKTSMNKAGQAVKDLVEELTENHGIELANILVSFSGSKGYHLEVFFNEPILVWKAKAWHKMVVEATGGSLDKIEFRPSHQGVKLPLGLHKVTGKKCYIVHPLTLTEMPDTYIFMVQQINRDTWNTMVDEWFEEAPKQQVKLSTKQATEFVQVMDATALEIPIDYEERCMEMLSANQLVHEDSRHNSTLLLLIYLNQLGYNEQNAVDIVQKVISNTYESAPNLVSGQTSLEDALKEVQRLYRYAVNYSLGKANRVVKVHEDEIKAILQPKEMHLKQLLFILSLHSKKYSKKDGVFYMTYKQMADYGADKNGARLLKYLMQLEELGYIEIIQRDTRRKNGLEHLPNKYKVLISAESENFIELDTMDAQPIELAKVVASLISEEDLKSIVAKKQYYEKFKPAYKAC